MTFDETELIEFFGVPPVEQFSEEKEFFGAIEFEVRRGSLTLRTSFAPLHAPVVITDLLPADGGEPVFHVELREAVAVRIENHPHRLAVLTRPEGEIGNDPRLKERLAVFLDPLKVIVYG